MTSNDDVSDSDSELAHLFEETDKESDEELDGFEFK
jgi:hypothetical protein